MFRLSAISRYSESNSESDERSGHLIKTKVTCTKQKRCPKGQRLLLPNSNSLLGKARWRRERASRNKAGRRWERTRRNEAHYGRRRERTSGNEAQHWGRRERARGNKAGRCRERTSGNEAGRCRERASRNQAGRRWERTRRNCTCRACRNHKQRKNDDFYNIQRTRTHWKLSWRRQSALTHCRDRVTQSGYGIYPKSGIKNYF